METIGTPVLLAEEFEKLLEKRYSVLSRVKKAKEKNEKIHGVVLEWLDEVDKLIQEMNAGGRMRGLISPLSAENYFSSMKDASDKLLKALQDDKCRVIGLFGRSNLGKTTLVKSEMKSKYENMFSRVIYVNLGPHQSLRSQLEEIGDSLNVDFEDERRNDHDDDDDVSLKIKNKITWEIKREGNVTNLLILDDFPTEYFSLDDFGVPDQGTVWKVLLIMDNGHDCTRHYKEGIYEKLRLEIDRFILLERISRGEAWELLQKLVKGGIGADLFDVAREVAFRCKGIPGLIKQVASSLDNKNTVEYWTETLASLHTTARNQIYFCRNFGDACNQFALDLYEALDQGGYTIFPYNSGDLDYYTIDEDEIKNSRCSIIVVSREYANDFRGLDELVKILESKEENKQLIFPIFYKVNPLDVKHVIGSFKDGLQKAVKKASKSSKAKMRSALYQLGVLPTGMQYIEGDKGKFIQEVVACLHNNKYRLHANGYSKGRFCSYDKGCTEDTSHYNFTSN